MSVASKESPVETLSGEIVTGNGVMDALTRVNLYQKIAAISAGLGAIQKDGDFDGGGVKYKFISHAALMGHLRSELARHNIVIVPEIVEAVTTEREKNTEWQGKAKVSMERRVTTRMLFTVIDGDDPETRFTAQWAGEGIDSGDKATQKAATSGEKYLYMKLFKVSDKDDPDAENPSADTPAPRAVAIPPAPKAPQPSPVPVTTGADSSPQQHLLRALRDRYDQTQDRQAFCTAQGIEYRQAAILDLTALRATELINALAKA